MNDSEAKRPGLQVLSLTSLCAAAVVVLGTALSQTMASAAPTAQPATGDPADFQAVNAVCSRCHAIGIFAKSPRSWTRWIEVFQRMTDRGADPTDEQIEHIGKYFLENLTIIDVNKAPAAELAAVLGVSVEVADTIVARRAQHKIEGLSDLASIRGVNPAILNQRKARILF